MFDETDWGPIREASQSAHPVGNAACAAHATQGGVYFEGGRIDTVIRCGGEVLRSSRAQATRIGLAQVRRRLGGARLRAEHLLFAPFQPRPVLLGLVRLLNTHAHPIVVDYTETWAVSGSQVRGAQGACVCDTPSGQRVLADAGLAIRGYPPDPLPTGGLALDARLLLPAGARRQLAFAYAAPGPGQEAAPLVRAWRGDAIAELGRTVASWIERIGAEEEVIAAYTRQLAELRAGPA